MIDQSPILIAGPPRCGTTMLAGLIDSVGDIWIGRGRTTMYPGSNSEFVSENQDIKNIMKREAAKFGYTNWNVPLPEGWLDNKKQIKEEIEQLVPEGTKWLVKTSWLLAFHKFWNWAYPDARWVLPIRAKVDILDSISRHPGMKRRSPVVARDFVEALLTRQCEVKRVVENGVVSQVHRVSNGDMYEMRKVLSFSLQKPTDFVKSLKWIEPGKMKTCRQTV